MGAGAGAAAASESPDRVPVLPWTARVQVLPGPGIVGRFGDVVVWLEQAEGASPQLVAKLLDIARSVGDRGDAATAGRRLAEVLCREPQAVPALVLVAPVGDGLQAVVHGWGRVVAGDVEIDGGWVDRTLAWTTSLRAGRGGEALGVAVVAAIHDLRRGTTPGGGMAVTMAPRPEGAGPARPPADADAETESPPAEAVAAPPAPAGAATVKGVVCGQGHFNNPSAEACEACGASLSQGTRILLDGIRPSLGSLVLDDGTTFDLDASHVIGCDPERDRSVAAGDADPIVIADPTGQVAAVHGEVRLVGWDVVLVPRAEMFVRAAGSDRWAPARPDEPVPLGDGACVALGPRTFTVHADPAGSAGTVG